MLTQQTYKAITVLHDIASHQALAVENYRMSPVELASLLARLECGNLIVRLPDAPVYEESSYSLARPLSETSLLDVLEATGDHLDCNHPATEEFYSHHSLVAPRLGVVNHMTRLYLSGIKLTDF